MTSSHVCTAELRNLMSGGSFQYLCSLLETDAVQCSSIKTTFTALSQPHSEMLRGLFSGDNTEENTALRGMPSLSPSLSLSLQIANPPVTEKPAKAYLTYYWNGTTLPLNLLQFTN